MDKDTTPEALEPTKALEPTPESTEAQHIYPERQGYLRRPSPIGEGDDDRGHYQIIPLSMLKGGETKDTKVYTSPNKHIVNESNPGPRGWYKDKHSPDNVRPRPCYSEAMLTSPYSGFCEVGCKFCYVDHGTRGYRATGLPTANPDYPDDMRKQVAKLMVAGPAYMSSFTEVFQRLEEEYHITQRLTQVFLDNHLPIFYLSRKIPPDWALEALTQNPYSYMQWSVNTSNQDIYKRISPFSYKLEELYRAIEKFSKAGVYVSIQCNPILAGIVTLEDIQTLVKTLAQAGADHVIFKFAEQVTGNRKTLIEGMARVPGIETFDSWLTQIVGGVYTIREDIRRAWLTELLATTRSANITMSLCYEYYENGKAGANMAPWFTTADQCHGPAVPIHYRPAPGEPFEPLPGCYRKGCLYCEEHGTMACQSPALIAASALDYKTMRETVIPLTARDPDQWRLQDSAPSPSYLRYAKRGLSARNPGLMTDAELWGLGPLPPQQDRKGHLVEISEDEGPGVLG